MGSFTLHSALAATVAAAVVLCAAAVPAARAVPITFAQFTEVNTGGSAQNLVFTRASNGRSGKLNTANTTAGDDVFFSFLGYGNLPAVLLGQQRAHLKINGGAGVTTTASAVSSFNPGIGTTVIQPFNAAFTLSFMRDTPFVPRFGPLAGHRLTNLLKVTVGPLNGMNPVLSGFSGTGALSGTFDKDLVTLTYSSDFLDFSDVLDRNAAVSFSAVVPMLLQQGNFLRSFRADGTGTFAADPAPIPTFTVPEPLSVALLGAGLLGLALVRRRAA